MGQIEKTGGRDVDRYDKNTFYKCMMYTKHQFFKSLRAKIYSSMVDSWPLGPIVNTTLTIFKADHSQLLPSNITLG